jgi:hypothetical protein
MGFVTRTPKLPDLLPVLAFPPATPRPRRRISRTAEARLGILFLNRKSQRVNNPKCWRSYAEETLRIAEQMKDPECKRLLMGVAETYAELARRALAAEASKSGKTGADH